MEHLLAVHVVQRNADLYEPEHHLALNKRLAAGVVDERVQLPLVRVLHYDAQHLALPFPTTISSPSVRRKRMRFSSVLLVVTVISQTMPRSYELGG
jgi:hypothetical protein